MEGFHPLPQDPYVISRRLSTFAKILFLAFLLSVLSSILPLRLLDRAWQLILVSSLTENAPIPLVGLGFLHLAAYLNPNSEFIAARRNTCARWAAAAAFGFLLLIPLQGYAAWHVYEVASANYTNKVNASKAQFNRLYEAISASGNKQTLQARLQALQGPRLGPADLNRQLPEIKSRLIAVIKQIQDQRDAEVQKSAPLALWAFSMQSLRAMATAFIFAVAFATGAQRRGSELPLLDDWMMALFKPFERQSKPGHDPHSHEDGIEADSEQPIPSNIIDSAYIRSISTPADEPPPTQKI